MAIKIFCDLCGKERDVNQIMGAEWKGNISMEVSTPRMDHRHFACVECLRKIGIPGAVNENDMPDRPTPYSQNALGTRIDVAAREDGGRDVRKRRRGVEVVLTWKTSGEFEVFSSIAAACDRIAEKTGAAISGADISHALLKDRVFNADIFCVRYAHTQTATASNELPMNEGGKENVE